jgi:hypothetical protein
VTDEDIFGAVMDAKTVQEGGEGGSDEVGDTKDNLDAAPTRNQALQACLLLKRYIIGIDDPASRKLEEAVSDA